MATPTQNSVGYMVFAALPGNFGAVQSGNMWGKSHGKGVTLTYSFPGDKAWFVSGYDEFQDYYATNGKERDAIRDGLDAWSDVSGVNFKQVSDGKTKVGELRFALTENADAYAHAYLPTGVPQSGDVWFNVNEWHAARSSKIAKGSYDYLTILHEIGHALGLKHPFEGYPWMEDSYDAYSYTVMSYTAASWDYGSYASFYPTTPMYYDLVAIQNMYGRGKHNPGNTTYTYKSGKSYWETIDDSGGKDTIRHQGGDDARIDLGIGRWSDLGKAIQFSSSATADTVMIGPRTKIERATGGSGDDRLIGNSRKNALSGGEGNDKLTGGNGKDKFLFTAKLTAGNRDVITDFKSGTDVIAIKKKLVGALDKGEVGKGAFHKHFDYDKGVLEYHGKAIVKLQGSPSLHADDLLVV